MSFGTPVTRGATNVQTSASSIAITPTGTIAVGRIAIACFTTYNGIGHSSLSDGANTWTKILEGYQSPGGTTGDGTKYSIWWSRITTQLTTSSTLTLTLGTSTARRIGNLLEVPLTNDTGYTVKVAQANGGGNSLTASVSSLTSREYLFLYHGVAQTTDTTKTPPTNFTERFDQRSGVTTPGIGNETATRVTTATSQSGAASGWTFTATTETSCMVAFYEYPIVLQATETDASQAIGKGKSLDQVSGTEIAQTIGRQKSKSITQVIETDIAQGLVTRISAASETDLSQPVGRLKNKSVGLVSESDSALAVGAKKQRAITQVSESDASQAVGAKKSKSIVQTAESETSQQVGAQKKITIGQTSETELFQSVAKQKLKTITQVTESETAQSIGTRKLKSIQQVIENDEALGLASQIPQLGQVNESDIAQSIGKTKRKSLTTYSSYEIHCDPVEGAVIYYFFLERIIPDVPEHLIENMDYLSPDVRGWKIGESANPSFFVTLPDDGDMYVAGIVAVNEFGIYSSMDLNFFYVNDSIITETDVAFGVNSRKEKNISQISETEISQIIGRAKRAGVAQIDEPEVAQPISRLKSKTITQVIEIDVANDITDGITRIEQVLENDVAMPVLRRKYKPIIQVMEEDFAQVITGELRRKPKVRKWRTVMRGNSEKSYEIWVDEQ